jgi:hypothetical protein
MIYIGIDPGQVGGMTFIDGETGEIFSCVMPLKKDKSIDGDRAASIIMENISDPHSIGFKDSIIYIEDVHAIFGTSAESTFNFGFNTGFIHGVVEALGLEVKLVQPKDWQKVLWEGFAVIKKPSKSGKTMVNDTKATSIMVAQTLFPNVDLRKSSRARMPHDGKADSLLIAEYGRRINKK